MSCSCPICPISEFVKQKNNKVTTNVMLYHREKLLAIATKCLEDNPDFVEIPEELTNPFSELFMYMYQKEKKIKKLKEGQHLHCSFKNKAVKDNTSEYLHIHIENVGNIKDVYTMYEIGMCVKEE